MWFVFKLQCRSTSWETTSVSIKVWPQHLGLAGLNPVDASKRQNDKFSICRIAAFICRSVMLAFLLDLKVRKRFEKIEKFGAPTQQLRFGTTKCNRPVVLASMDMLSWHRKMSCWRMARRQHVIKKEWQMKAPIRQMLHFSFCRVFVYSPCQLYQHDGKEWQKSATIHFR